MRNTLMISNKTRESSKNIEIEQNQKFSIAIPCRNEGKSGKLEKLLSILVNEKGVGEIIVVDNNSDADDSTPEIIKKFRCKTDIEIKLIQEGSGTADARNLAVKNSNFSVIFFLDADTLFTPSTLSNAFEEFERKNLDAAFFNFESGSKFLVDKIIMAINNLIQAQLANSTNPVCMGAALLAKKQAHEAAGGFPLKKVCEDSEWLRAILRNKGKIALLSPKFIFDVSRWRDSKSGKLKYETLKMYIKNAIHFKLTGIPHLDMDRAYDYDREGNPYGEKTNSV